MPRVVKSDGQPTRRRAPAKTPEGRQEQLIAMAFDQAEYQLREHTASSQVLTHFLELGTVKAALELERLRNENLLLKAKAEAIESGKDQQRLYADAINAMRTYGSAAFGNDEDH